tara:strand:- start:314 stop:481 length:168 start_codon:yes stop_codon:yes gene_type:complete
MKFELNETEHQMLRDILNKVIRYQGLSSDEDEETLNALHEKIVLYWVEEAKQAKN